MSAVDVTSRYVTADFKTSPLIALADLLGLKRFAAQIRAAPDFYGPILSGIVLYRHLSVADRCKINHAIIYEGPKGHLQANLITLISDLSVQQYWYMWSLSDEELKEFFSYNKNMAVVTDQFNPISPPNFTAATFASGLYLISRNGFRASVPHFFSKLTSSPLVTAAGKKFGLGPSGLRSLGGVGVVALIIISGLNIMAKKNAGRAKQELAARGLLMYSEL